MEGKYDISAFNYPYKGDIIHEQTDSFIVALFYLIKFRIKYDAVLIAVDWHKRK